jgi:DNA-directed RNA polymerase specialized sigma24 family protein
MQSDSTCWTVIRGAAAGCQTDRDEFARRYGPVVHDYLAARWRASPHRDEVDDGVQDVFVECFREGGIVGRADAARPGGFRAFLFGVVRNVALRIETRRARDQDRESPPPSGLDLDAVEGEGETVSRMFERAWAKALVREALALQAAAERGMEDGAAKRADLLRVRFFDGLPIREISRLWNVDPAILHHDYARARTEFHQALQSVVAFEYPGATSEAVEQHCRDLLAVLNRS